MCSALAVRLASPPYLLTHLLDDLPDGRLSSRRRLLVELVPLVDTLEVDRVGEHHEPLGVLGVDLVSGEW